MYFPYLRGKQFELLALKELAPALGQSRLIHPIIEPVRELGGGLVRSLADLEAQGVPHTLIVNPSVGHLAKQQDKTDQVLDWYISNMAASAPLRFGVIVDSTTAVDSILTAINDRGLQSIHVVLIHDAYLADNAGLTQLANQLTIDFQLVEDKSAVRRYGQTFQDPQLVWFKDGFQAKESNLDYLPQPVTFLTDQHLYYAADGYVGFADFLTIGRKYSEGGSLPRAVIIHFSFQSTTDHMIYVRHFSSDSNADQSDTAGKFAEALAKLVAFTNENQLDNPAIQAFRAYFNSGSYPGLGVIKKLSMENHLYLMMDVLGTE
jgi:hypothetical protein